MTPRRRSLRPIVAFAAVTTGIAIAIAGAGRSQLALFVAVIAAAAVFTVLEHLARREDYK